MKMNKSTLRIMALIVLLSISNIFKISAQSDADKLRALFGDECILACFMDIEPGVTTLLEVETQLQQENISYSKNGNEESVTLEWALPPQEFVTDGASVPFILIIFLDDVVLKIIAPLNAPLDAVIEVFGAPHRVTQSDAHYYMTYPDQGLLFIVLDFSSTSRTFALISEAVYIPNSEITNPSGENIIQTCMTYGVSPCIAPTATPTQIPLPTAVPTITPSFTPPPPTSVPPTPTRTPIPTPTPVPFKANAGPDQSIQIVHDGMIIGSPIAYVTLNGSQSTGSITGYQWSRGGQAVSNQSIVTLQLVPGTYVFTLTISNGTQTNTDNVMVYITSCRYGTVGCGSPTE